MAKLSIFCFQILVFTIEFKILFLLYALTDMNRNQSNQIRERERKKEFLINLDETLSVQKWRNL